ncbi:MAG: cupredoxin domain-containing protein [Xanthomonadaceae bacterium]|nr:cupredoxin domain-containing protein [Xanthomonadaceae bacterium]
MERLIHIVLLLGLASHTSAHADVRFVGQSDITKTYEDEQFPESSFGAKPVDPVSGRRPASSAAPLDGAQASDTNSNSVAAVETGKTNKLEEIIPDAQKGTQEVALIASETGFYPQTLFVTRGVPVRMFVTGASKANLCVMVDSFDVKKQIKFNRVEEITFLPKFAGQFRVHCPMTGMQGTLVVKEDSLSQSTSRSVASEPHGTK